MNLRQISNTLRFNAGRLVQRCLTLAVLAPVLVACGGSSEDSSSLVSLRVANVTLTHAPLKLLVDAAASLQATARDSVSAYAELASGSRALSLTDAGRPFPSVPRLPR